MSARTLRARRLLLRIRKRLAEAAGRSGKIYFRHRVDEYRKIWGAAAELCGAEFHALADDAWEIRRGSARVRVINNQIQLDDPVTLQLAGRKAFMHRLLGEAGLPVPDHVVFTLDQLQSAFAFLARHPDGCVVKPASGTAAGDGVSTHLRTDTEVRDAAILASLYDSELLIEPQVEGECYRALVVGGHFQHAVCRRGPRLEGDGRRTVRELIQEASRERVARGERPLEIDRDSSFTLGWQGLSPDAVPDPGREWIAKTVDDPLASQGELRTVYTTDVTAEVGPAVRLTCERAAAVLGSDFVGVDLITRDATRALEESGGVINEVNTTPALHHHYDEGAEALPAVAVDTLELALFRAEQRTRSGTGE